MYYKIKSKWLQTKITLLKLILLRLLHFPKVECIHYYICGYILWYVVIVCIYMSFDSRLFVIFIFILFLFAHTWFELFFVFIWCLFIYFCIIYSPHATSCFKWFIFIKSSLFSVILNILLDLWFFIYIFQFLD